jgi:hypothetical protein
MFSRDVEEEPPTFTRSSRPENLRPLNAAQQSPVVPVPFTKENIFCSERVAVFMYRSRADRKCTEGTFGGKLPLCQVWQKRSFNVIPE